MNSNSRTENSKRNLLNGFICFFCTTLLTFIVRTLFIKYLDVAYLGINGLYSNILQLLSLSELGLNSIALYTLYKPVANNEKNSIRTLLHFYSKLYKIMSIIIFIIGICLCPFLPIIINSELAVFDLTMYYILFVLNTSLSYVGISNQLLINADQKVYIIKYVNLIYVIFQNLAQILILLIFKNYYFYLIIQCLSTVLFNFTIFIIARNKYPFIKDKCTDNLDPKTKKGIIESLKNVFLYKLSVVIINCTDNIFISILLGTSIVGYYSNYAMIISVIVNFVNIIINSISSSIGNLNSSQDVDKKVDFFYKFLFLMQWLVSVFSICIFILINDVIIIWIGEKYLLSSLSVFAIMLNFYISNIINPVWIYRETMGMFKEVKTLMLKTAILNIIFTYVLGYFIGLPGIFFATVLSRLLTTVWKEPILLLKGKFNRSVKEYYYILIKYVFIFLFILLISYILFSKYHINSFVGLCIKTSLLFIFVNVIYLVIFYKNNYFKYYLKILLKNKRK